MSAVVASSSSSILHPLPMLHQPRRLARSGAQRGPPPQPTPNQRTFRPYTATQGRRRFWSGKLPLLIGVALFLVGYRFVRLYQLYTQQTATQQSILKRQSDQT